jgi:quinol-cytochrome oxidoreductase complex cytochrome b subunit
MAKKHMPWEEIALWSLLGGVLALGLGFVGLWIYRWAWDDEALRAITVGDRNLYALSVFGIGFLLSAVILMFGSRTSGSTLVGPGNTKRRR